MDSSLDKTDFSILSLLQQDGRMSLTVIAKELGVSVSTARTRVNRLLEEKTIQIIGRVNTEKVGFHAYAHINVSVRPARWTDHVAGQLMKCREVSFLAQTTGDHDLEVDVMCRDNDHLTNLVNGTIARIKGVYHIKTEMYSKVLKYAQPDLNLIG